jgi:hypothetical protein
VPDQICIVVGILQGKPMREACAELIEVSLPAGHWLSLERRDELIQAMRNWLTGSYL